MRKSVSFLMALKAEVLDDNIKLHELSEQLESDSFNIMNLTTEEIRADTGGYVKSLLKDLKANKTAFNKQLKKLELSVKKLREFF